MMRPDDFEGRISRRQLMRLGLAGAAGVLVGDQLTCALTSAAQRAPKAATPRAKAVIELWLWGGPSHLDTFDPKPEAGHDYCGPFDKPIETNVSGIRICQLLPLLAKQADKYSLIRSMTHDSNAHETASYWVQTGRPPESGRVYPGVGSVVSLFKGYAAGYQGLIPPYVVLTRPQGRFSESGFLGSKYKPFVTGGDPARPRFAVEGIVAEGITDRRQQERRNLLCELDALNQAMPNDPRLAAWRDSGRQAYELILGDGGKVFDLSREKPALRDSYGRSTLGQSCLAARRLVEHGVPYVTINNPGWDTHSQNFEVLRRKLPELDKALSTLLVDLKDRGLLESTVIWCGGEFGRTPKIQWSPPWNGGRGHWCWCFSMLVAGGGFRGGQVVGQSNFTGEHVKDRPVYPCDLLGSIYELMGIDLNARLPNPEGFEAFVTPRPNEGVKCGGLLKEIML